MSIDPYSTEEIEPTSMVDEVVPENSEPTEALEAVPPEGVVEGQPTETQQSPSGTAETAAASATPPGEGEPLPDHLSAEQAYAGWKYHQQQADLARNEAEELRKQMDEYRAFRPLIEGIVADPSLLSMVSNHMNGGNGQAAPAAPEAPALPPPPELPTGVYDEDGEKYLKEFTAWQRQVAETQQAQVALLQQQLQEQQQLTQRSQQSTQAERAIQAIQFEHGFSREEATRFMSDLNAGKVVQNEALLLAGWKAQQQPTAQQVRDQQALQHAQQQQQQRTPATATAIGGQGSPPAPTNGLFVPAPQTIDPYAT